MKRRTRFTLVSLAVIAVMATGFAVTNAMGADDSEGPPAITVTRGDIVDKALAVGTIEPETSVGVKSKVSGVVSRAFADEGDYVEAGSPLLEIRPDPTPLELVEARRQLEMRQIELDNLTRDIARKRALAERGLIPRQDLENTEQLYEQAALQVRTSRDKLQLLEDGRIAGAVAGTGVESVVRAPISGYILDRTIEIGDPVVPLSSYQEGTVLMTMADMSDLIFRGSVDEIDVGRLTEGMPVEIRIGALPNARITGVVAYISLQAVTEENATTFPIEIALKETTGATLRAGFSANAEVIIRKREDVLLIPERTVTFDGDTAWVNVMGADGKPEKRVIQTGLSDAIQIEVLGGLEEGDEVLEKPERVI
ncbi:MAG TPA: efflux RND transporter periplasmic adaptor subunit [Longimicrobiaceae bacterium]|nr:efflux RND transporter periplasmic adaptor subunit [Longimicrobiaceae bacterium]